ncbi:MAG TPA: GAF domain-containing protein [Candidatus Kryptonia bacterium]|nr:GAF domain-containing protein [Candidatus Kryptonia bacterium]
MPAERLGATAQVAAARSTRTDFTDVGETLETLGELTTALFHCEAVAFFVWDHAAAQLRPAWQRGLSTRAATAFAKVAIRRGRGVQWDRLLVRPNIVVAMSRSARDPHAAVWREWPAVYASPLRHAGRLYGVVCLFFRGSTSLESIPNRVALRPWCAGAALAISLAQLAEHERGAVAHAMALSENLHELTAPLELREMLGRLSQRALETEGLRACAVILRDAATHRLRVAALAGASADFVALAVDKTFPDQLLPQFPRRGYVVLRPDVLAGFVPIDPGTDNVGRTLVVPVSHDSEIVAVLALVAPQRERTFSSEQIRWAQGLAEQVAVVIETGRLYQRARVLAEVAAAPSYPFDREGYLVEVAQRVRSLLGATVCTIWLWEPTSATMQLAARSASASPRRGSGRPRLPVTDFTPRTAGAIREPLRLVLRRQSRLAVWLGGTVAQLAPIQTGARVFGALIAPEPQAHADRAGFANILAGIADVTALRLEQQALLDQAAGRERELARHREREQLARDLHDTVLQTLTGIGLQLTALQRRNTPVAGAELAALEDAVGEQFRLVQAFLARLRRATAHPTDLRAEVQQLVDDCTRQGRVRARATVSGVEVIAAPIASEIALIIREALANVEKHACANRAAVSIRARNGYIDINVHDSGRGFPAAMMTGRRVRDSSLPWSIRERVAALGGRLRIDSPRRKGTFVRIRVPYSRRVVVEAAPNAGHSAHRVRRTS